LKKSILAVLSILLTMLAVLSSCASGAVAAGWAGVTVHNGNIYTVSGSGQLNIISVGAGDILIREGVVPIREASNAGFLGCGGGEASIAVYGTPAVLGNMVYFAGYNGKIYVYDLTTQQLSSAVLDEKNNKTIVGGPIVSNGRVYIASSNGNIYSLHADTLAQDWKFSTKAKIWSTPVLSNGVLFFGSFDKKVYAVDAVTGQEKWSKQIGGAMMATPLVSGGVVYAVSLDRNIYAFDEVTGEQKWRYPANNQNDKKPKEWFWATPVLFDGFLYAPCMDGNVYAVDIANPSRVVVFDLDSSISSSPVVSNGKVVVVTERGRVYTLNATGGNNGTRRMEVDLRVSDSQPSLLVNSQLYAENGIVYIHSLHPDKIYAVNADNGAFKSFALESVSGNTGQAVPTVTVLVPTTITVLVPTTITVPATETK